MANSGLVRVSSYKKRSPKLQITKQNLDSGMMTDLSDNTVPSNAFRQLINVDLDQIGAIKPRTGYLEDTSVVFIPDKL